MSKPQFIQTLLQKIARLRLFLGLENSYEGQAINRDFYRKRFEI